MRGIVDATTGARRPLCGRRTCVAPRTDTTPPSAPGTPSATYVDGAIRLAWASATDDVGVVAYVVASDSGATQTTSVASATVAAAAGTTSTFTVTARDAAGNVSAPSGPTSITVPPPAPTTSTTAPSTTGPSTSTSGVPSASTSGVPSASTAGGVARFARVAVSYSSAVFAPLVEAPRHGLWIAHGLHGDLVPAMEQANPDIASLLYKIAPYSDARNTAPGSSAKNPGAVNYADAVAQHPEWFLLDAAGARITYTAYSGYTLMDIGNGAYQDAWAANAIATARAAGWTGIFADELSLALYSTTATPARYPTPADWQAAVSSFLANVGAQVRAAGLTFICNTSSGVTYPSVRKSWLQLVDGTMEEGWMRPSVDKAQALSAASGTWPKLIQELKDHEAAGKTFIAVMPADTTDVTAVRYGLASFLLAANGHALFDVSGTTSYTAEQWFPDYDTARALGAPSGAAVAIAGGAYRRDFANGVVVVNPTSTSVTVNLGGSYSGSGLSGVTSVALGPTSGAVLLRD